MGEQIGPIAARAHQLEQILARLMNLRVQHECREDGACWSNCSLCQLQKARAEFDKLGGTVTPAPVTEREAFVVSGLASDAARLQDRVTQLEAEARRFYRGDGSYVDMDMTPAEVIALRVACAAQLDKLKPIVRRVLEEAQIDELTKEVAEGGHWVNKPTGEFICYGCGAYFDRPDPPDEEHEDPCVRLEAIAALKEPTHA